MPDPFPLNETALQAASEALVSHPDIWGRSAEDWEDPAREVISTYLREAEFWVEYQGINDVGLVVMRPTSRRLRDVRVRLIGPWLPIDQGESR